MIYGERIRLRAITRDDLPHFVEWLNDPEVTQGLMHYLPFSMEDEETWYESMRKGPKEEHPLMIDICSEEGWEPIGDCGLFGIDWRIRQAEFGIVIGAKQHWDKGYGTEALELMIQHGFHTLNLNRISLRVYENNPRAIRSYEKAGLSIEGRLRQGHYDDGQYFDVILMSILRSEWQEEK
jgi:RimJ/RimL family protein N-acetyltransferase